MCVCVCVCVWRPLQVYLVEIADSGRRGVIGSFGAVAVSLGIVLVYSLGAALPWRVVCVVCGAIPAALFVAMWFLPETPVWLATRNRKGDARKVGEIAKKNQQKKKKMIIQKSQVGKAKIYRREKSQELRFLLQVGHPALVRSSIGSTVECCLFLSHSPP